ncbi:MarR family transcriptional regulator [Aquibium sp. LZ166]|uniref:MarR family transcriptional regulator n=1 Tax=Aquibium pacificus TaxID=3153579 RepID=A0ABV3SJD9_9HYPH
MPTRQDSDSFGFIVGDISRLIRAEMERRIAAAGLSVTPGEGRTLLNIARIGTVRQNVLAERMGVEAMTLSGYVDRLEQRCLVSRAVDPADRRAKLVSLTSEAEGVVEELRALGDSLRADLSRTMRSDEWDALMSNLRRIREDLAGMKCKAPAVVETGE